VADISWVDALICSVDAEISVAMAAASSAAVRMAPTRRRSATTMECTDESRSPTSAASVRSPTTVTDKSPPATRLAIAPAAFTGSVTRRLSRRQNTTSSVSAAPNSATVQSTMLVAVVRATAYAAVSGSRNTTHHFPSAVGTVTTRSALPPPPGSGTRAVAGCDCRGMSAACASGRSRSVESGVTMRRPCASTTSSRTPPGRSAAARSFDRRSSANTALRTPTGRATRGARMAISYSSETTAADESYRGGPSYAPVFTARCHQSSSD